MQSLEAIGVYLEGPHSIITDVECRTVFGVTLTMTLSAIIAFINGGNELYTVDGDRRTRVVVVCGTIRRPYIRTLPNDSVADNLLSLPVY